MKIYRVSRTRRPGLEHDGFEFYSNKREAEKVQRQYNKDYENQYDDDFDSDITQDDEIDIIDFEPTKQGIIDMLTQWGDIANNG